MDDDRYALPNAASIWARENRNPNYGCDLMLKMRSFGQRYDPATAQLLDNAVVRDHLIDQEWRTNSG
jgi:hypothetical protein